MAEHLRIHLLEYIAFKMGTTILSDLPADSPRLRHIVEQIPLDACSEKEWLDAARYLWPKYPCRAASDARALLIRAEK